MDILENLRALGGDAYPTESAAADEIERLRNQVASLEKYEAMVLEVCGELETFDEYRAALSGLAKDAERYRWLRQAMPHQVKAINNLEEHEWDAAIDAAMVQTHNDESNRMAREADSGKLKAGVRQSG